MTKIIQRIGRSILNFLTEFGQIAIFIVRIIRFIPRAIKDRRIVIEQMAVVGSDSLPLVLLIGSFTGAIAALEATMLFNKFNLIGITKPFLGASIANAVFTELTPVLTALVIAGRVGGAIAAQLGTMSVSEQIDALEMMAIDKNRYLAMPRVLAAVIMMPILAVFSNIVALLGSFVLVSIKFEFSAFTFFDSVFNYFQLSEILTGITKSFLFGAVTSIIGCHVGFATSGGAEGVGKSTVRAFTISASAILVIDALFGYLVG
jgi:phospholipid/cholesterol/gamma-HCH transport system permease protein